MKLYNISLRLLFSSNRNTYTTFSLYFSLVALCVGIFFYLIIIGFSKGYETSINSYLSSLDGDARVFSSSALSINNSNYNFIKENLDSRDYIKAYSPFIQRNAIIKKKNRTYGVVLVGIEMESFSKLFNIEYSNIDLVDILDQCIIGEGLADILSVHKTDKINIINAEKLFQNNQLSVREIKVGSTFKTTFSQYSNKIIYLPLNWVSNFYSTKEIDGFILSIDNLEKHNSDLRVLFSDSQNRVQYWYERHHNILKWLKIFDKPLFFMSLSILFICVYNLSHSIWVIVFDKLKSITTLYAFGFSRRQIRSLLMNMLMILVVIASLLGSFLAFMFNIIQNKFSLISIDPKIYLLDTIHPELNLLDYSLMFFILLFISVCVGMISINKTIKLINVEELKND